MEKITGLPTYFQTITTQPSILTCLQQPRAMNKLMRRKLANTLTLSLFFTITSHNLLQGNFNSTLRYESV